MLWTDRGFKEAYRERLEHAHRSSDAELQAQAQAFQAEVAKGGGSSPEHFLQRAGNAATAMLHGYVKSALDGFDETISSLEADLEEPDLTALRESLEKEIARRAKALPASLHDFCKPVAHPALLRSIVQQAPEKARELLAERVEAQRERIQSRARAQELIDRGILIGQDARDAEVAEALKRAIMEALGPDAPLYTSSELVCLLTGSDGVERVLGQLRKNRMTLMLLTSRTTGDPWLWWAVGVSAGLGRSVYLLRANGIDPEMAFPVSSEHDFNLSDRNDVRRLLQSLQREVRRFSKDPSEIDLTDVVAKASWTPVEAAS